MTGTCSVTRSSATSSPFRSSVWATRSAIPCVEPCRVAYATRTFILSSPSAHRDRRQRRSDLPGPGFDPVPLPEVALGKKLLCRGHNPNDAFREGFRRIVGVEGTEEYLVVAGMRDRHQLLDLLAAAASRPFH